MAALGDYRGEIYTWRWDAEATAVSLGNSHATVRAITFAPNGKQIITGGSDGSILVWSTQQRALAFALERAASPIVDLSFSPEGGHVAVATRAGVVDLRDSSDYERTTRFVFGKEIQHLQFSGSSQLLGLGEKQDPFRLLLKEAQPSARYATRSNVLSLAWAANATDLLVSGLGERGVCHLNLSTASCGDKLPVRATLVRKVAYFAKAGLYAIAGTGGRIEFWDAEHKLPRTFLDVPIPEVRDLTFLEQERALAIVGNAPTLVIIDVDRMLIKDQEELPCPAQSLHLLRERGLLAIGLRNGQLVFRSLATGQLGNESQFVSGWPIGIAASEQENWIAVADDGGRISFFDLDNQRRLESLSLDSGRLTAFAHSERQNLIAVGGECRCIHLISTTAPRRIVARVDAHQGTVRTLLFDPGRDRLFSGGDDGLVRLWELGLLRSPAVQLIKDAERQYGMRLEAGRLKRVGN
ncbi:MAG TPA: WD40 repeat domain-containing protein [Polyangiaceae bacterium]|nr:WD40 repeat domain-containing protein [Polyangiaceae bacterium]